MFSSFFKFLPLKRYIFSFIAAFAATLILLSVLCVLFSFFPPLDLIFEAIYNYSGVFSSFLAAVFCSYSCGKRGMLTGLICADIYAVLLFIAGSLFFNGNLAPAEIAKILILTSFCGAIGGIIGINCK